MRQLKLLPACSLLLVCLLALPTALQAETIIDDFTMTGNHGVTRNTVGTSSDTQTPIPIANTIGGSRTLQLEMVSSSSPGNLDASLSVVTSAPFLKLSSDTGVSVKGRTIWDSNGAGLGGIDLTSGGFDDSVGVTVESADNNLQIEITITDLMGDIATFMETLTAPVTSSTEFLFAFEDFVGATNVDFTMVNSIQLMLTGPQGQDGLVSLVRATTAVPEPTSVALWLLGLLASAGYGYRRRRTQLAAA